MRLIDADKIRYAKDWVVTDRISKVGGYNAKAIYRVTKEVIDAMPTVDAVPVVHGHWIKFGVSDKDGNHQYRCSVCECEEIHSPLVKVSYCWNCGARMDGKGGNA